MSNCRLNPNPEIQSLRSASIFLNVVNRERIVRKLWWILLFLWNKLETKFCDSDSAQNS